MDNKTAIKELKRILEEGFGDYGNEIPDIDENVLKYICDDYILLEAIKETCEYYGCIDEFMNSKISEKHLIAKCKGLDDCREGHHNNFKTDESQSDLVTFILSEFLTDKGEHRYSNLWAAIGETGATDEDAISESFVENLIELLSEDKPRRPLVRTVDKASLLTQQTNLKDQIKKHEKETKEYKKELAEVDKLLATV